MSNAKMKREVAAHIAFRKSQIEKAATPKPVMVTRPHEKTFVALNRVTVMGKNGKPKKRKAPLVSVRKYDTVTFATRAEVSSSMDKRPGYVWYDCANR